MFHGVTKRNSVIEYVSDENMSDPNSVSNNDPYDLTTYPNSVSPLYIFDPYDLTTVLCVRE